MCRERAAARHVRIGGTEGRLGLAALEGGIKRYFAQVNAVEHQVLHVGSGFQARAHRHEVETRTARRYVGREAVATDAFHKGSNGERLCRGFHVVGIAALIVSGLNAERTAAAEQGGIGFVARAAHRAVAAQGHAVGEVDALPQVFGQETAHGCQTARPRIEPHAPRAALVGKVFAVAMGFELQDAGQGGGKAFEGEMFHIAHCRSREQQGL